MSTLVADGSLSEKLGQIQELTSIADHSGRLLGYFTPAKAFPEDLTDAQAAAYFTPERLAQAKARGGPGRSLTEIWRELEQRKAARCGSQ